MLCDSMQDAERTGETMARVTTAEDLSALHPSSQGVIFTPGPHSTRNRASLCSSRQRSIKPAAATPGSSVLDPTLFSWDVGQILLQKIAEKEDELKTAFPMLDVGRTLTVTKGEFRRVIETFLFHLAEAEFDAVLAEITKNVKNIIRCCRLFDYGRAEWIQRHTLKQILETTCFRMKDLEFEKLWNCYCVRNSNVTDYKEFLKNFGLSSAYEGIEKAFRAIDVSQSGFVSLDYLKSVINGFIFPLPNETFQELMNRVNPARGDEAFSSDTVLQKLHRYIRDAYPPLKQAFLMLDESQDGKIMRNYLYRVLRNLVFQMKDREFQELIEVEEILSDKITENFREALQSYDPKCTGTINRSHLRKVLQLCCFSLSDQHFMKLCYKYKDNSSDGIFYKMLLDNLKVAVLSGDLNGISSHISKERQQREEKRQTELSKRIKQIEDQANKYAQNRTVDEVVKRLKDSVIQQEATAKDSFFTYNKHEKINKAGLQKVLEDHGMPMDDSQFNLLTEKLGSPDGGLSFLGFVAILEAYRTEDMDWESDVILIEEQSGYYLSGTVSVSSETNIVVRVHYSSPKHHAPDLYATRAPRVDKIRYDTDAKGYLTQQEFLQKLGIEFAPADTGLSKHIMEDSYAHLQMHYNNQQKKHSKLEEQQKQQTKALHVKEIKKQIKLYGNIYTDKSECPRDVPRRSHLCC
ncbi:ef-hand calcium-binding domain-containing protein 6 [Limosa lapponica baueri]|uniref:Ef-hand calcium-binding domain-containing protein 6 n=1 Tax=Limosa lapponica baueri TaxID=1758121 RepID=A0A2I0U0A7_LIMLA|nr:ef-hand calcium-binding domain-containing protein 6 [Limosa lapponica baueri]